MSSTTIIRFNMQYTNLNAVLLTFSHDEKGILYDSLDELICYYKIIIIYFYHRGSRQARQVLSARDKRFSY